MPRNSKNTGKPIAEVIRHEVTYLPELTPARLAFRRRWARRCHWFVRLLTQAKISGLEHFPANGPGLIVSNHLGDFDAVLGLAYAPVQPDAIGTTDLYDHPKVGNLLNQYGMIWIHRGTPDRKALRCALEGLEQGRFLAIAPEGRQSLTGALEKATGGAAFLALRSGAPIIPMAMTGTEDENVYGNLRRLRRPKMTLAIGKPLHLVDLPRGREGIKIATHTIMEAIAALLPETYRGVYAD